MDGGFGVWKVVWNKVLVLVIEIEILNFDNDFN